MKIYLCAREDELFKAWQLYCGQYDFVTVTKQDIMSINADAIVSPANSFGFMTGGIDLHYRNYFGKSVEDSLQERITDYFDGELCVGQATSVEIPISTRKMFKYRYLISAPTMRTPENVSHTINAFLAAKAALMDAMVLGVKSIVFPGMGTGTGCMSSDDCAKQVSAAIRYVLVDKRDGIIPLNLYEEQDYIRKYVAGKKWYQVQIMED